MLSVSIGMVTTALIYKGATLVSSFLNKENLTENSILKTVKENLEKNWVVSLVAFFVFLYAIIKFKNIIIALSIVVVIVVLPYQIAFWNQRKKKLQVLEQLSAAINLFTSTFAVNRNIIYSIEILGQNIPSPLGDYFRKAHREIVLGEHFDLVLNRLSREMGFTEGYIFIQLIKMARNQGEKTLPLFQELNSKVLALQEEERMNQIETNSIRYMNLGLLILPLPLLVFFYFKFPETAVFLSNFAGQLLILIWLASIILWFLIDRMVVDN